MKLRTAITFFTFVAVTAACTSDRDLPTQDQTTASTTSMDSATAACPAGFVDAIDAWGDVGFDGVITLLRGDKVCTTQTGVRDPVAGDPMTADTVFAIGSVSKSFTAAAVLQLVADGRLALHDKAGTLVLGLSGPAASATVAQLLTHTSGLQGGAGEDHTPRSRAAAVKALSTLPRVFPAGSEFGYTNGGYTLLALIIDEVTGDYRSELASRVLQEGAGFWDGDPTPDGPRAVGYTDEERSQAVGDFAGPHWALSGNGDLAMTVPELAAWTAALFDGDVLPPRATAALEKPRWDNGDGTSETFGWVRFDKDLFGAAGFGSAGGGGDTGHNVIVAHVPTDDTTIAIASSTDKVTAEQLMQAIIAAVIAEEDVPLPKGADVTAPDAKTIKRITGTYRLDDGDALVITEDAGAVVMSASGIGAVNALFSLPRGFTTEDVEAYEKGVVELLTSTNAAGKDERDLLNKAVGGIDHVRPRGTIVDDNELRTYVTVVGGDRTLEGWYALDSQGGVAAAQVPADPPSLRFENQRGDTLIASDPTGRRADVRLTVDGAVLTIDNGSGVVTAQRSE